MNKYITEKAKFHYFSKIQQCKNIANNKQEFMNFLIYIITWTFNLKTIN